MEEKNNSQEEKPLRYSEMSQEQLNQEIKERGDEEDLEEAKEYPY